MIIRRKKARNTKRTGLSKKAELALKRILDETGKKIRARGLKHEQFKPGRYSDYYEHGHARGGFLGSEPIFFRSMEEESLRGSTPGYISDKYREVFGTEIKLNKRIPQISQIPKDKIGRFLLAAITIKPEDRAALEKNSSIQTGIKRFVINSLRQHLAAIDWAENTYGIRINVDPELLKWIGKAGRGRI